MGWLTRRFRPSRARLRIDSTPLSTETVGRLVALLPTGGHPAAADTAELISRAHERQVYGVTLDERQREAVQAALTGRHGDPGELCDLRRLLGEEPRPG